MNTAATGCAIWRSLLQMIVTMTMLFLISCCCCCCTTASASNSYYGQLGTNWVRRPVNRRSSPQISSYSDQSQDIRSLIKISNRQKRKQPSSRISPGNPSKVVKNGVIVEGTADDSQYDFVTQSIEDLGWKNPDAAIGNPLKGFLSFPEFSGYNADLATNQSVDISLEAYYIGLDEIMIGNDTFDWEPLEQRLDGAASRSRHVVVSIVCHYPNWHKLSVPQYILDDGLELFYYPDFLGGGHSPNYGDARLLNALEQFIAAFGNRYDGDPRIGFLNLGLLGFWGEWHTYPHDFVPEQSKISVISWYNAAFKTTKLLARYPHKLAYESGFGLVDGSFTYETIDGEANGNEWRDHYFWPSIVNAGQTDFWQKAPMGGETRPEQQPVVFESWYPRRTYQKQDFVECVQTTHATYMAHHDMFINDGYSGEKLINALHAHARLGYNFMISKVGAIFPDRLSDDGTVQIDVTIDQVGVAPFYYPLSLFLDCPDMIQPLSVSGVETLIEEGDSKTFSFRNVPRSSHCMEAVHFYLNSTEYGYWNRPIKFAQGVHGSVQVRVPLPTILLDRPDDVQQNHSVVFNLVNVNVNSDKRLIVEVESGMIIDLARVGQAITIKADIYNIGIEAVETLNSVAVEFRFNGRVHYEQKGPFVLAGHRGEKYNPSLYLRKAGIKKIQAIVYNKSDETMLFNRTLTFTIVDSRNKDGRDPSQVPIPSPVARSVFEVFAPYLFKTSEPSTSPRQSIVPPATFSVIDSSEIHGFNTPSTPSLLVLEERRRRIEFRYNVTIPIVVSTTVMLVMSLLSCLLYRRWKQKRIIDNDNHDGVLKNPI